MLTRFLVVAKTNLIFAIRILICVDFVRKPAKIVGKVYFHSKKKPHKKQIIIINTHINFQTRPF